DSEACGPAGGIKPHGIDHFQHILLKRGRRGHGSSGSVNADVNQNRSAAGPIEPLIPAAATANLWQCTNKLRGRHSSTRAKPTETSSSTGRIMVPGTGIEPVTRGFSIRCSTN